MSQLLSLGAIHKATGEYIYPKIANKKEEYIRVRSNHISNTDRTDW